MNIPCAQNGAWLLAGVLYKGLGNELVSSDRFSGEVRKMVELWREGSWRSLETALPRSLLPTPELTAASASACLPRACCFSHFP